MKVGPGDTEVAGERWRGGVTGVVPTVSLNVLQGALVGVTGGSFDKLCGLGVIGLLGVSSTDAALDSPLDCESSGFNKVGRMERQGVGGNDDCGNADCGSADFDTLESPQGWEISVFTKDDRMERQGVGGNAAFDTSSNWPCKHCLAGCAVVVFICFKLNQDEGGRTLHRDAQSSGDRDKSALVNTLS